MKRPRSESGGTEQRGQEAPLESRAPLDTGVTKQFLGTVIDNAPLPLFVKDSEGTYLYVNGAYEAATLITADEAVGHTDFDLYSPEIATAYRQSDLEALDRNAPVYREEPVAIDGEQRTFAVMKFPISNDRGELVGTCGVSVDISESVSNELDYEGEQEGISAGEFFNRLLAALTPQEAIVLDLLAEGLSDADIAKRMSLTPGTVRHHVSHLLKKLRKRSRTEAVVEILNRREPTQ